MKLLDLARNARANADLLRDTPHATNPRVLARLAGPAWRGLVAQQARHAPATDVHAGHDVRFDWTYARTRPELARLYEVAKRSQWNASDLDWDLPVDPYDPARDLFPEAWLPIADLPSYRRLGARERARHRHGLAAWMLSQFLHGEQAALFAACQVTEAVAWMDGKLYGSTQVMDEGRHVEVFHRYLDHKLEKRYEINDNLYTLVDALLVDDRWDLKFLGMQIMIEGLALGAFGILRGTTKEPLLAELLRRVITDEARHVHYGVVALEDTYARLPEPARREREDWAYEVAVLMRNRFLAHEFYEEFYAHAMSRKAWDRLLLGSAYMERFRRMMFKRLVPNLRRIHLLSDRIRPHYEALGLLEFEGGKAAPELTAEELLSDTGT